MFEDQEPNDSYVYNWLSLNNDTVHFYLEAVKFYEGLLHDDIEAIRGDKDLAILLFEHDKNDLEIQQELDRTSKVRVWIEKKIEESGPNSFDYDFTLSHRTARFLKSVGLLYLQHLKNRRNILASKPRISTHVLKVVDQKISYFEEKTRIGIFRNVNPLPLLVNVPEPKEDSEKKPKAVEVEQRPRPVVLGSIEILDPELRSRCLDLFQTFKTDGQHQRLDTVVAEATRILESKLRSVSGAPPNQVGLDLAKYAFGGNPPKLIISNIAAEQEAVYALFRGVFGFIRNPVHHRLVEDLTPERVLQVVGMIDYLIYLVENAIREGPGS